MNGMDEIKEIVEKSGSQVGMGEPVCLVWKAGHGNCFGCPSELDCGKVTRIGILILATGGYTPTSFSDYQEMHRRTNSLMEQIMTAQTPEELKAVPSM